MFGTPVPMVFSPFILSQMCLAISFSLSFPMNLHTVTPTGVTVPRFSPLALSNACLGPVADSLSSPPVPIL
ncbi:hypothetical protein TIFTF001_034919 [Ficus carica]|uniref:Secreted protein n=1 Tax=Ficus carica TaxID=3494 RepID=A0AA88E3S4_FICCA|nr:hypothetical protein TIFTF001_034919 [Ficus carica]